MPQGQFQTPPLPDRRQRIIFRCSAEQKLLLNQIAAREGISMSEVIRRALDRYHRNGSDKD